MASEFEYRHRFAIIALVFVFAYAFYNLDHLNIVYAIVPRNSGVLDQDALARLVYGVSAFLAGIGAAILTWASAYRLSSPRGDQPQTVALLVGGPYRYVRNPHYIGYFLLVVALGSFQSRLGFPILIAAETLLYPSPYRARRDAARAAARRALSRILQACSTASAVNAPSDCG
jgi:protein-S-isoprenylcysteine O-methyltransferase Ste14